MTNPYADEDGPLIPRPELMLPALRQAVAAVVPSRLPGFFEDLQKALVRVGDEDSVVPTRMFYRQRGVVVEIERHPAIARSLHAADQARQAAPSTPTRTPKPPSKRPPARSPSRSRSTKEEEADPTSHLGALLTRRT